LGAVVCVVRAADIVLAGGFFPLKISATFRMKLYSYLLLLFFLIQALPNSSDLSLLSLSLSLSLFLSLSLSLSLANE
jgi:hypothetical protein